MKIKVNLKEGLLTYSTSNGQKVMGVSCRVRTLANGQRKKAVKDVVRTIPQGIPYDPVTFPVGLWNITAVEWRKDKGFNAWEYGDVKIRTDAFAMAETWMLDYDGNYDKPTGNKIRDEGYLLHYSSSRTTLGCIRFDSQEDANEIGRYIEQLLPKHKVQLEVCG